jgi:hypothetical protein
VGEDAPLLGCSFPFAEQSVVAGNGTAATDRRAACSSSNPGVWRTWRRRWFTRKRRRRGYEHSVYGTEGHRFESCRARSTGLFVIPLGRPNPLHSPDVGRSRSPCPAQAAVPLVKARDRWLRALTGARLARAPRWERRRPKSTHGPEATLPHRLSRSGRQLSRPLLDQVPHYALDTSRGFASRPCQLRKLGRWGEVGLWKTLVPLEGGQHYFAA